jgi:hypothetical protein
MNRPQLAEDAPKLVDAAGTVWYLDRPSGRYFAPARQQPPTWAKTLHSRAELAGQGPLRAVQPPTDTSINTATAALTGAGSKAVATLAVALHQTAGRVGGVAALTVGRPGANESMYVRDLAHAGAQIAAARVDLDALTVLVGMLTEWMTAAEQVPDLGDTLQHCLRQASKQLGSAHSLCDRWLRHDESLFAFISD